MSQLELRVPDLGDFKDVTVIEVHIQPGDEVRQEQALLTLETDKATMDVPATLAGTVSHVQVKVGDKVSQGSLIATLNTTVTTAPSVATVAPISDVTAPAPSADNLQCQVLVLGGGPGGYTAAFRAADLGLQVTLVERYPTLGGVCLNVGCIPSKALLHAAKTITDAEAMAEHGIRFGQPEIDLPALRAFKEGVVGKLTGGLSALAKQRKVTVIQGTGTLTGPNTLSIIRPDGSHSLLQFQQAILAAGSSVVKLPGYPYGDPRLIDSTGALALADIPERMLVVGGGIIGLEMACVYDALGSRITVAELGDGLIPGADRDLVKPLESRIRQRYEAVYLGTKVSQIEAREDGLWVRFEGAKAPAEAQRYDKVLVAVGRSPNGRLIGAEAAGVTVNERGFIPVDGQCRTNIPHIFAIGDLVGQPMLAHKATHEAKVAAEVIAGHKAWFDARTIPSIAYTDPEVAWMGLTETEAKAKGIAYEKAAFPWAASGRALGNGRTDGITKLLVDPETQQILGAGIAGVNAGELLAEAVLALEMQADVADMALTIHAHPTLSETLAMAAEMLDGSITDLMPPRKSGK